jgi:hypothetical protein
MKRYLTLLWLSFLFISGCFDMPLTFAQNKIERWALENRGYYNPLIAEPRAANVSIMFLGFSDAVPFVQNPGRRRVWDISLGKEIPIFGIQKGSAKDEPVGAGQWGLGLWIPVSFHMIEDFKDESNPILNTDYRFSGMFKIQKGLTKTSRLGGRIQVGHESTHLGDEFSLAARRTKPDFERINVSYEYWEYGVSFETDRGKDGENHLTFRHGGIGLLKSDKGYYSDKLLEPDGRRIPRSARNFEPSFGFQWYQEKKRVGGFGPFISVDARYKTVYDYNKPDDRTKEDKQMSYNLMIGLRRVERKFLEKGIPDLFFRYYHGVNPAGQFRSQKNYQLLGFGIYVEL